MLFKFVNTDARALAAYEAAISPVAGSAAVFEVGSLEEHIPGADVLVSAANSRLFFDGGSDLAYLGAFPDLTDLSRRELRRHWDSGSLRSDADVPHLPVGAAMLVPLPCGKQLLAAPTMILPQTVTETENAYYAFKAMLHLLEKAVLPADAQVLVPGLCTGVGGMSAEVSAAQIVRAWREFHGGVRKDACTERRDIAQDPTAMSHQPPEYMNSLFVKGHAARATGAFTPPQLLTPRCQGVDARIWW
ncbi:hypothetical protein JKP88DRAFT_273112 [Tribonema minus]|uniref:Macro domain-containing protein n=1 Tax=Tribonema minus TaxID=303371 RepID=A0A835YYI2_9STRA|nr:hypothetical protein JKP88DRAFT_273112 [Tribonema minus]